WPRVACSSSTSTRSAGCTGWRPLPPMWRTSARTPLSWTLRPARPVSFPGMCGSSNGSKTTSSGCTTSGSGNSASRSPGSMRRSHPASNCWRRPTRRAARRTMNPTARTSCTGTAPPPARGLPMMSPGPTGEHARRAAATYGGAAAPCDLPELSFWDRFGAATVSRLRLAPGQRVLDLCCGAGASALPAARAVGPAGRVLGVDVAAPLLALARRRAADKGLANIEFRHGGATGTGRPGGSFDAGVCVFGVFFAPDLTALAAGGGGPVGRGGVLAVTTWGPGLFEPGNGIFWEAVAAVAPSLYKAFNPWDEITTPEALAGLLAGAGVAGPAATPVRGQHPLGHPEQF